MGSAVEKEKPGNDDAALRTREEAELHEQGKVEGYGDDDDVSPSHKGWGSHMLGFHSLWRGFRSHLRAAEPSREQRQKEGALKGVGVSAIAVEPSDTSAKDASKPLEKPTSTEVAKPASATAWALGALLDWRKEQQEEEKKDVVKEEKKGAEVVVGGQTAPCRDCQLAAEARGAAHQEAPRLKVQHDSKSMQPFLARASTYELRMVSVMSVLCDMAYTIPQIKARDMQRTYGLRYVISSLDVKARALAREKRQREKLEQKKAQQEKVKKLRSGSKPEAGLSVIEKEGHVEGEEETQGGLTLSPAAAIHFASAAASYIHSHSIAFLPGGSSEDKGREDSSAEQSIEEREVTETLQQTAESVASVPAPVAAPAVATAAGALSIMASEDIKVSESKESAGGEERKWSIGSVLGRLALVKGSGSAERESRDTGTSAAAEALHQSRHKERRAIDVLRGGDGTSAEAADASSSSRKSSNGVGEEGHVREGAKGQRGALESAAAGGVAEKGPGGKVAAEPVCPCEWFICDDEATATRYIVIQGSDSLASWQTNLSFEPCFFEDATLGVQVHRGIYEAAKALYSTMLPYVRSFVRKYGPGQARIQFTGHSLGGSLATLLNLMLNMRGEVAAKMLPPVYTFGSPTIMCGGDFLLDSLKLLRTHLRNVLIHRDLVPRAFACDYPNHVAEVLRRMNGTFKGLPCLRHQGLMYAPMGTMLVLQPPESVVPFHPLLPPVASLFSIRHPEQNNAQLPALAGKCHAEVRAAQRALLNAPHPLEILADPGSYGSDGSISRHHDPRNYTKALHLLLKEEKRRIRRQQREQRRTLSWPMLIAKAAAKGFQMHDGDTTRGNQEGSRGPAAARAGALTRGMAPIGRAVVAVSSFSKGRNKARNQSLIASRHVQLGLLALLSCPLISGTGPSALI